MKVLVKITNNSTNADSTQLSFSPSWTGNYFVLSLCVKCIAHINKKSSYDVLVLLGYTYIQAY